MNRIPMRVNAIADTFVPVVLLAAIFALMGSALGGLGGAILLPCGVAVGIYFMTTSFGRLAVLCGGTMVMFGASPFGPTIRALFPLLLVFGIPLACMSIAKKSREFTSKNVVLYVPLLMLFFIPVISLYVAAYYGTDMSSWIRDATTFILIPIGLVYGMDAGLSASPRVLQVTFSVLGITAALAFSISWLVRRHQLPAGAELPLLSSSMIVIPVICMSLSLYFTSKSRLKMLWAISAMGQMLILVAAGGRSSILYCAAMVVFCLLFSFFRTPQGTRKSIILLGAGLVMAATFYQIYAPVVGNTFLVNRLDWFANASLEAVGEDASGQARIRAYEIMWNSFMERPLFGNGFGYGYQHVSRTDVGAFTLDTPLVYLAKFGIMGTIILLFAFCALVIACVGLSKYLSCRSRVVMMWGAAVLAWIATMPSGAPTEQKGFGIGLAVLVAITLAWCKEAKSSTSTQQHVAPQRVVINPDKAHKVAYPPQRLDSDGDANSGPLEDVLHPSIRNNT